MGAQDRRSLPTGNLNDVEIKRQQLQDAFDIVVSIEQRRKLGQFATPSSLAQEITNYGVRLLGKREISFLEPAIGTGSFYSALLHETGKNTINGIGIEIDPTVFNIANAVWLDNPELRIVKGDFTELTPDGKCNLLLCNPPYVRHQLLEKEKKRELKTKVKTELGIDVSGLAGLYCYFMLLSQKWLAPDAICGWLVPSEFMDVNYGKAIKQYLLNKVTLLRIHRYNPTDSLFDDALVSSCVVWIKNTKPLKDYKIEFSYGGTHDNPTISKNVSKHALLEESKWTRFPEKELRVNNNSPVLGDFFDVKRGIATGDNNFFIFTKEQISNNKLDMDFFTPILPMPRFLKEDEIFSDKNGVPELPEPLFLLNINMNESEIQQRYPNLWNYLLKGKETTAKKYLCRNRKLWYLQERREPTAFLCTYMGRNSKEGKSPFRFIYNHSDAIATNSFLMLYPNDELKSIIRSSKDYSAKVWKALRHIKPTNITDEGRVYGGGLKKIEPKELKNVEVPDLYNLK